jgi:hypothetical protein
MGLMGGRLRVRGRRMLFLRFMNCSRGRPRFHKVCWFPKAWDWDWTDLTGVEWHGMDTDVMMRSLNVLVKQGKAQIFGTEGQEGVKFF